MDIGQKIDYNKTFKPYYNIIWRSFITIKLKNINIIYYNSYKKEH
jgi:hypothetical protein